MFEVKAVGDYESKPAKSSQQMESKLVFVYGTLKQGYSNHYLLASSTFVKQQEIEGFKLYNSGFPVAVPSEGDTITGEVWRVTDPAVMASLDRLEGEGVMYDRTPVSVDGLDLELYVGNPGFWGSRTSLRECPKTSTGVYIWGN